MSTNPFLRPAPNAAALHARKANSALAPRMIANHGNGRLSNHKGGLSEFKRKERRFFRCIAVAGAALLVLVMFVAREIVHARAMYRLGMVVARSEALRRDTQKSQRIDEVWRAYLIAEVLSHNTSLREGQRLNTRSLVSYQWR